MRISEQVIEGYEQVVTFTDDDFHCVIALHNTKLGPAIGGCRVKLYPSNQDALVDALRLSKGMTYKNAAAGLDFGGAKAVVFAARPTRDIMLKVGEAVNYFNGRYITAEDVGTTLPDIEVTSEVTPYTIHHDGSSLTALGVFSSIQAATTFVGIASPSVWVQGLGKVGYDLASRISNAKFKLVVNDLRPEVTDKAVRELGAERDHALEVMVYAPCAMGQVVTPDNEDTLFPIICGAANNQLVDESSADLLRTKGVLYCPDWIVNAGGVIAASCEIGQEYDEAKATMLANYVGDRLTMILQAADDENTTPLFIARRLAEQRFMRRD